MTSLRYLSVCSGIEAATQAWHPLGWQCAGVSEIEAFPRAVLEQRLGAVPADDDHRWREGSNIVPLFGDFTKIEAHHVGPIDLLVGGTPCQSFSIAGKRLGLDDPRGNLTLEFLALARRVRPRWIVWENVPGVLSHDEGRTMGTFLRLVGECGFRWAYRVLDAQYIRVGRFGRAVPQRRRRVFLVGYSGTADIDPRAVLFDRESLRGNPAPRREAGQGTAADVAPSLVSSGRGVDRTGESRGQDPVIAQAFGGGNTTGPIDIATAQTAQTAHGTRLDFDSETFVAHALRGEGFDASEDGTGRGTPIVPCYGLATQQEPKWAENVCPTLQVPSKSGGGQPHCVAIQERAVSDNPNAGPDGKGWRDDGAAYTLEARAVCQAVAFDMRGREGGAMPEGPHNTANIRAASGGSSRSYVAFAQNTRDEVRVQGDGKISGALAAEPGMKQQTYLATRWGVRRLMPVECARLQGFPDDWTQIEWRGKPADKCPDGPQYKAYGNSMAVNVMAFIGERIDAIEAAAQTERREAA